MNIPLLTCAGRRRLTSAALWLAALLAAAGLSGCTWDHMPFIKPVDTPPPPADSFVLRADGMVAEKVPEAGTSDAQLAGARELFRRGDYVKAETLYHRIAENKKNTPTMAQEARYYEAECLRLQGRYPKAADTYVNLLNTFPQTAYREQAVQHVFDIANFWLEDTRQEMIEAREAREGKRWFVWPRFVSLEKSKPFLDREGNAVDKLEQVRFHDLGQLGDKALFLAGSVKFFNEDFKEADFYFSQIYERHPSSTLAAQAVELAIISKSLSTGGSDYDGRKVAEARKLVDTALRNYPELAKKKEEFLVKRLSDITNQQAEKEFKMAEFWRRTNHPCGAYFYYDMITRRYPRTEWATKAEQLKAQLKDKVEKEQREQALAAANPKPGLLGHAPAAPVLPNTLPTGPTPGGVEVGPAPRPTQP